jgi:hypothetical protein
LRVVKVFLTSFVALEEKTTCRIDLTQSFTLHTCVFVMILIPYRQICFRLLNSHILIDDERFLCAMKRTFLQRKIYVNFENEFFGGKSLSHVENLSVEFSSTEILINQFSLSYHNQLCDPSTKQHRENTSRSSKKAIYFILLSKSSGLR